MFIKFKFWNAISKVYFKLNLIITLVKVIILVWALKLTIMLIF